MTQDNECELTLEDLEAMAEPDFERLEREIRNHPRVIADADRFCREYGLRKAEALAAYIAKRDGTTVEDELANPAIWNDTEARLYDKWGKTSEPEVLSHPAVNRYIYNKNFDRDLDEALSETGGDKYEQ